MREPFVANLYRRMILLYRLIMQTSNLYEHLYKSVTRRQGYTILSKRAGIGIDELHGVTRRSLRDVLEMLRGSEQGYFVVGPCGTKIELSAEGV